MKPGGKVAQWEVMQNPNVKPKRQGRIHFQTPTKTYPMNLIQHGWDVLERLDQLDYLTSLMVAKMYFWMEPNQKNQPRQLPTARNAANEMCLRRLKDLGLVEVVPIAEYPTPKKLIRHELNLLTRQGVELLKSRKGENFIPNWTASLRTSAPLTYDHALKLNNVLANLLGAFRQAGGECVLVLNDKQLKRKILDGQTYLKDIQPDALLVVKFGYFLKTYLVEVDAGTEVVRGSAFSSFDKKIDRYGDYLRNRFVSDPLFAGLQKPQILVVTTGAKRAQNLKDATLEAGGRKSYWFTAFSFIEPPDYTALDAVWMVPTMEGYQSLSFSDSA